MAEAGSVPLFRRRRSALEDPSPGAAQRRSRRRRRPLGPLCERLGGRILARRAAQPTRGPRRPIRSMAHRHVSPQDRLLGGHFALFGMALFALRDVLRVHLHGHRAMGRLATVWHGRGGSSTLVTFSVGTASPSSARALATAAASGPRVMDEAPRRRRRAFVGCSSAPRAEVLDGAVGATEQASVDAVAGECLLPGDAVIPAHGRVGGRSASACAPRPPSRATRGGWPSAETPSPCARSSGAPPCAPPSRPSCS